AIVRPEEAGFVARGVDPCVDALRVPRGHREPRAALVVGREPLRQLLPGPAAVGRLEDAALAPAADHLPDDSAALIRRRVDDIRVARLEHDLADAGVVADVEDARPRLTAVGRLVEPAVTAG